MDTAAVYGRPRLALVAALSLLAYAGVAAKERAQLLGGPRPRDRFKRALQYMSAKEAEVWVAAFRRGLDGEERYERIAHSLLERAQARILAHEPQPPRSAYRSLKDKLDVKRQLALGRAGAEKREARSVTFVDETAPEAVPTSKSAREAKGDALPATEAQVVDLDEARSRRSQPPAGLALALAG